MADRALYLGHVQALLPRLEDWNVALVGRVERACVGRVDHAVQRVLCAALPACVVVVRAVAARLPRPMPMPFVPIPVPVPMSMSMPVVRVHRATSACLLALLLLLLS